MLQLSVIVQNSNHLTIELFIHQFLKSCSPTYYRVYCYLLCRERWIRVKESVCQVLTTFDPQKPWNLYDCTFDQCVQLIIAVSSDALITHTMNLTFPCPHLNPAITHTDKRSRSLTHTHKVLPMHPPVVQFSVSGRFHWAQWSQWEVDRSN